MSKAAKEEPNLEANEKHNYEEIKLELFKSKAQLRQLIDLMPDYIFGRDYEGNFLFVNDKAAAYMGSTPDALIGVNYKNLNINVELKEQHLAEDRKVIDTNEQLEIPLEKFIFPDGKTHYVKTIKVPFTTNDHHTKGVLGISYDVTRFIQINKLKDKYISQLEELTFHTSHIVRQPLTSIMGIINLIEDESVSKNDLRDILKDFKEQVIKLDNFTKQLNDSIHDFKLNISAPSEDYLL